MLSPGHYGIDKSLMSLLEHILCKSDQRPHFEKQYIKEIVVLLSI